MPYCKPEDHPVVLADRSAPAIKTSVADALICP
jgi:hypothetical protein